MLNEADPSLASGSCFKRVEASRKVIMPEGVIAPAVAEVTIAVKLTGWPGPDGFGEDVTVVVEALA